MHRIDTSTAQVDKFGAGKNGFTGGNPQTGELPTALDETFFDSVQEEIAAVIEAAGIELSKNSNIQLLSALRTSFSAGRLLNVQTFTSSGTYTPTPGTKSVVVEVQAGGGGSGGCPATGANSVAASGGGGSGAYAQSRLITNFANVNITVGSGGAAGASGGGTGGVGGVSSFGDLMVCPGGTGGLTTGTTAVSYPASRGGSTDTNAPSGGNIVAAKGKPGGGTTILTQTIGTLGYGGTSRFSAGGGGGGESGAFGSGACGVANFASHSATSGFSGGNGIVIVWEYA